MEIKLNACGDVLKFHEEVMLKKETGVRCPSNLKFTERKKRSSAKGKAHLP